MTISEILTTSTDADCWEMIQTVFKEHGTPIPEYMIAASPMPDLLDLIRPLVAEAGSDPDVVEMFERGCRHVKARHMRN